MRYVCKRCGKILIDAEAIRDPDDDISCEQCYLENITDWFDDEEETEEEPVDEVEQFKPGSHELTGAIDTKKSFWRR